ncbi:MAG: hypothetical protein ACJAV1_000721 [Paraglaciecola sp.]
MTGLKGFKSKTIMDDGAQRGGARVTYYHFDQYNRFYLLTNYAKNYAKNEISDLISTQKKQLKDFMEVWKHEQTSFICRANNLP